MKRLIAILLVVLLLLSLCACGETEATYALGETAKLGDVEFTLKDYRYVEKVEATCLDPDHFYNTKTVKMAKSGCQMVYILYTIKNNGKTSYYPSSADIHLEYGDGYIFGKGSNGDYYDASMGPYVSGSMEISPLESVSYRHVIQDAPKEISTSTEPVHIVVKIGGETAKFKIR